MSLLANVPTLSYIQWKNMLITYKETTYQIENSHTNKPYIYWDINNPYVLTTSNTKLSERNELFYLIFNDSGTYTVVPNDDIEMHFSENPSRDVITNRIVGLSNETKDKFVAVQIDIDGIKFDVYDSEGKFSKLEQKADSIDLEVKGIQKQYSEDVKLTEMRENFSASLLSLQATLGLFSSDMNFYMEDNRLTDEEKNKITAYKTSLEEKRIELNAQLDIIETYLENMEEIDEEKIIKLNSARDELNTAINNLFTNIDTVCVDNVFTNTEITAIVTYFGKVNLEINECKNLIDECIFLGIDGLLIEEVSSITLRQNEIKLDVKRIENDYVSQSTFTQTTEQFEFKISQSGVGNLIVNGRPTNINYNPWVLTGNATWYSSSIGIGIMAGTTSECFAFSNKIQIKGNRNFSFSCKILTENNTNGYDIYVLGYTSATATSYAQAIHITGSTTKGQWINVKQNFTLNSDIQYFRVRIDNNGRTSSGATSQIVTFFTDVMVLEGHDNFPNYRDSFDGISNNIVTINRDGINVANNNASTTTSMTANGFYINQSGHGDVFKVDGDGISIAQGITTLNKNGLTINSPNYNVQTYIDANGLNVVQNGSSAIKVHSNGLEISQGIVSLNKNGLTVNSTSGNIRTVTNGDGFYIYQGDTIIWKSDRNGIYLSQGGTYIDKDRIKFTHSDGTYTEMNASGLIHYESGNGRKYHYLVYGGEYTCYSEETVTITLPSEFRGKNFSIITAIKRIYAHNNEDITGAKYPLLSFYAEALNKNISNGTFQIYASVRAWNRVGTSGLGTMVGDGSLGTTEANLLKPVVAYWVFV